MDQGIIYRTAFQMARWVIQPSISHDNVHVHAIKQSMSDSATLRQQVLGFHRMYDLPVRSQPTSGLADVSDTEIALRIKLNVEEVLEWLSKGLGLDAVLILSHRDASRDLNYSTEAYWAETPELTERWTHEERTGKALDLLELVEHCRTTINVQELADASGDVKYVFEGADLTFGIPSENVSREIHASNMTKTDNGKVLRREDGKILKGPNYMEPQLHMVINYRKMQEGELNHG